MVRFPLPDFTVGTRKVANILDGHSHIHLRRLISLLSFAEEKG